MTVNKDKSLGLRAQDSPFQSPQRTKIVVVTLRAGAHIHAGSERYAWDMALSLAREGCEVQIWASRSTDYIRWNNDLPAYEEIDVLGTGALCIRRFPVLHSRQNLAFKIIKRLCFVLRPLRKNQNFVFSRWLDKWFLKSQGPWCPDLWKALAKEKDSHHGALFIPYLYAPTPCGVEALKGGRCKSVVLPAAHDEPEFEIPFVGRTLGLATHLAFISQAEQKHSEDIWPQQVMGKPHIYIPPGVPELPLPSPTEALPKLPEKFFLCLGRLDRNKNIPWLLQHTPADVKVVFAGDPKMPLPESDERFLFLGRVSDGVKRHLLEKALALLMVSQRESYSMVTAEALALGTPVLALAGCAAVEELVEAYGGVISGEKEYGAALSQAWIDPLFFAAHPPRPEKIRLEKSWAASAKTLIQAVDPGAQQPNPCAGI